MKKFILSLFALCLALSSTAQTWTTSAPNIYYTGGNVGIGTNNPVRDLSILGASITPWVNLRIEGGRTDYFGNTGIELISPNATGNLDISYYNDKSLNRNYYGQPIVTGEGFAQIRSIGNLGIGTSGNYGLYFGTNNTNVMSILPNGNIGIGTTTPSTKLDVQGSIFTNGILKSSRSGAGGAQLILENTYGVSEDWRIQAGIPSIADNTFAIQTISNSTTRLAIKNNGYVGIGTTSPTEKLSVDGTVLAKKVRVSTAGADWPDFVFAPNFKLRTLNELEAYIKANQHLPEVPSAKEVEENGLDLGKMDATLLQKVEELTLYTIEQEKKIEIYIKENSDLKKETQQLKAMFLALKKEVEALKEKNKE
ncbi:hypothetical protein EV198_2509 [Roseivirga ehrenbergii]|uniref:BZIP transcription factor n=1 Tax=Roseivirga ehrenbergii (strain DSM 102268 / JCM 13514 / KCTC 12282 / NCIMB 14502 / KMM 6017) TaxID=279360 RepID=A0A150XT37_ROSEK|nr:bZIP transcription factor [Roseivirga ehrenbergii]KYG81907.1 hypothetical protein MB14_00495 [Roseivirga ehrenbergii]TCL01721.1 hypothetical protein EV198_2509 [Roseivirga ehrenbergii]